MKKFYLLILTLLSVSSVWSQPAFQWATSVNGTTFSGGFDALVDLSGNAYSIGNFSGTQDFDPGPGVFNLASNGSSDIFIQKLDASGNFLWAKSVGGTTGDNPSTSNAIDATGNVYVTGWFTSTVDFDPGAGVFNMTAPSANRELYILKLDASGNFVWAKQMGGILGETGEAIHVDALGNIFLAGDFNGTVDFDPGPGTFTLTANNSPSADIFVCKLSAAGNLVWVKQMGGANNEIGQDMAIDASGNTYYTGYFDATGDFDPGPGVFNLTCAGARDIFISKLDSSGNFVWAKSIGSTGIDEGSGIAIDSSMNFYITGHFSGTADFDPGPGTTNLVPAGGDEIFLCKFTRTGNLVWAKRMGGTNGDRGLGLSSDASGGAVISGYFNGTGGAGGTADFDPGVGIYTLTAPAAIYDGYLAKYDSLGNFMWAFNAGATAGSGFNAVTTQGSGKVYYTGSYKGTVDFNPGAGVFNLSSTPSNFSSCLVKLAECISPTLPTVDATQDTICSGSSTTLSITSGALNSATQWQWYTVSCGGTSAGSGTSINVSPTVTTTYFVRGEGGCIAGGACASITITVNTIPAQPAPISGSTTVCLGTTNTYSFTNDPSATSYTWTIPGTWTGTSTTNSINTTAGATGGTITVTANNTCGSSTPQTLNVTVNTIPAQPSSISGSASICQGSTNTYSVVNDPTATSYTWTFPGDWTGNSTTNSITLTAGAMSGTITVTANNTCGISTPRTLAVSVTSVPAQPGMLSFNTPICPGTSNTFSVPFDPFATDYTWDLPLGWTGTSTTNSINVVIGVTGGVVSVTANNGCGSSIPRTATIIVVGAPAQPNPISGNTTVCAGSTNTYSVVNDPTATSYTWTFPAGWSGASTTNSITLVAGTNGGTITVTANNDCGSSPVQTLNVTVITVPAQPSPISGDTIVCTWTTHTYSVTNDPTAASYTWILPVGWSGNSTTNSITAMAWGNGGTISVTADNACGSSSPQTLNVSLIAAPTQPGLISGNISICDGSTNTYSVTNDPNATDYTWTLPAGWSGASTSNSITATAGATGGTITVIANNSCGSSIPQTLTVTVNTIPVQPVAISGDTIVCEGSTNTYSVTNDPNATSYTWTLPAGWSGTSNSNSIAATAGATGGTITVIANNACGSSTSQTLNVTVITVPAQPGAITGNTTVCEGSTNTYSVTNDPNATSYTWTLPGGWSGSSITNSITTTANAASGNVIVTANNSCGSSATQTLPVTVNTVNTSVTDNSPILTANATGATYQWIDCNAGNTPIVGATNQNYTATVTGDYAVIVTQNGCTDTSACTNVVIAGMEDDFASSISVYPNPTSDVLNIMIADENISLNWKLMNALGQVLMGAEDASSSSISLIGLSEGIYLLQLANPETNEFKVVRVELIR